MNAGVYPFEIGAFKCLAVSDGDLGYSGTATFLFANAPQSELEVALLEHHETEADIQASWTCLVIDTGSHRILVDTGGGGFYGPGGGKLLQNLGSAGFDPASIDTVILSHGHGDHIGGVLDPDGTLSFKRARYLMSKEEWDHFSAEAYRAAFDIVQRKSLPPLKNHLETIDSEGEILPGIRGFFAAGHTTSRGLVLEIFSEGEKLLSLGDLFLHPIHIEHPSWYSGVDSDPERLAAARRRFLKQAGEGRIMVHLYHFDFPGLGFILPKGEGWLWQPAAS